MQPTNKILKPFLTVAEINSDFITIGITNKYRVSFPNDLNITDSNELYKYNYHLDKLGLLNEKNNYLDEAHSRTKSFLSLFSEKPSFCLKQIKDTKILILGVGGLGSRIALELASLNLDSITIVDPDILSFSNLQRMFYFERKDIGQRKVDLIKERCASISPETKITAVFEDSIDFVFKSNLILYDFIFITADAEDGTMAKHVGKKLKDSQIPHIIGAYWESKLIVGPLIDNKSETDLTEQYNKHRLKVPRKPKRDYIPPSIGHSNSIISGFMLNEMIKYITTKKSNLIDKQLQIDAIDLSFNLVDIHN
jgi:hypothetical protein